MATSCHSVTSWVIFNIEAQLNLFPEWTTLSTPWQCVRVYTAPKRPLSSIKYHTGTNEKKKKKRHAAAQNICSYLAGRKAIEFNHCLEHCHSPLNVASLNKTKHNKKSKTRGTRCHSPIYTVCTRGFDVRISGKFSRFSPPPTHNSPPPPYTKKCHANFQRIPVYRGPESLFGGSLTGVRVCATKKKLLTTLELALLNFLKKLTQTFSSSKAVP